MKIFVGALMLTSAMTWAVAQQSTITPTAKELNKSFDADASQFWTRWV
jgi:hypothetical protein